MTVYGDDVFDELAVEPSSDASVPVAVVSDDEKLRQMGKDLGLFQEETTELAPEATTDPLVPDDVPAETVEEQTTYGFKSEEDFQAAALKAIEAKIGAPLDSITEMLSELATFRNEATIEKQKAPLIKEWGAEFDDRYAQVIEKYQTLSPAMQESLDNVEGARLIWALIEKEGGSSIPTAPRFDRSGVTTNRQTAKFAYTQTQIESMSTAQYRQNSAAIDQAYRDGLVDVAS